jgi:peptidyl-prolyl cis-trans isomerase C
MKKYPLIAAVTGALLAAGCNQAEKGGQGAPTPASAPQSQASPANTKDAVAVVNGKPISKASVEVLQDEIGQRRGGAAIPEDKIVDELIKRELLRQEAESQGLTKDPKIIARLENAQRMVTSQAAAEHFINTVQVSDEDLKKEYDQRIGPMSATELKAKHILVDSERTAKDIIAKLQKGEKFADLAKKFSKDPSSKDTGGELGWFSPQQMVPPFSQAVMALKNGEMTKTPVQSQFGWHVIVREESRDQPPPPFDAVKDQLKSLLQTQKLQQHLADLQGKAKIENRVEPKPEAPAAPAASDEAKPAPEAGQPPAAVQPAPGQPAQPAPATPEHPAPTAEPSKPESSAQPPQQAKPASKP